MGVRDVPQNCPIGFRTEVRTEVAGVRHCSIRMLNSSHCTCSRMLSRVVNPVRCTVQYQVPATSVGNG